MEMIVHYYYYLISLKHNLKQILKNTIIVVTKNSNLA